MSLKLTKKDDVTFISTHKDLPPVAVIDRSPMTWQKKSIFAVIAIVGAVCWYFIAAGRGESLSSRYFVIAALCSYVIAYRFYARLIENKIVRPRDERATAGEVHNDGQNFEPTDRRVLFGHHFAAIAGAGPLVGPVLASQMGYLPGTIWIIVGVVFAGAVHDYLTLWISLRRDGRSLPHIIKDEMGTFAGWVGILAILTINLIVIAVLAIVMIKALAGSPWGVFSIGLTIPIAIFMGVYLRYIRPGKVTEVSVIGVVMLLAAIIVGGQVAQTEWGQAWFTLTPYQTAWCVIIYGFVASVLPVWLLLAPRDYLSTYMKLGTIFLLAAGLLIVGPAVQQPAMTQFAFNGEGPVFAGDLFPFLFITIACGALSGFHSLTASGTTPKLIEKERQARFIGYGGMLGESLVAMMALMTAVIIDPHVYFAMNAPAAMTGSEAATAADYVVNVLQPHGYGGVPLNESVESVRQTLEQAAQEVQEERIVSRTGGAPTLAFGLSQVFHDLFGSGEGWRAFWYHFAIMFEALFILTAVDAGTRSCRFTVTDAMGNMGGWFSRFKDPSNVLGNYLGSFIVVGLWGSIVLMGVTDPLGGIYTLFPLFGIANQLLAAGALTIIWVIIHKKGYHQWAWIAFVPLIWDLFITVWASMQKLFHPNPKIGFWAKNRAFVDAQNKGLEEFGGASSAADIAATVRNTYVQFSLQALYVVLIVLLFGLGVYHVLRALKGKALPLAEEPGQRSLIFAGSGLLMSAGEKKVAKQWAAIPAEKIEEIRRAARAEGLRDEALDADADGDSGVGPMTAEGARKSRLMEVGRT